MRVRSTLVAGAAILALAVSPAGLLQAQMKSTDLRVGLNTILEEHVYLAAAATGAALGGRQPEFEGAAAALDQNSVALSQAIGSVYGPDAEAAFLALWRKHIGFVVDYTTAVAAKDKAKQDRAVNDLLGYAGDFGAFLNAANPNLPKDVVAGLVKTHIVTLKDVIDAQAAGDPKLAWAKARDTAGHMKMIADPLADGIAKQFPKRFALN
jgi:hypothetical protein